MSLPPNGVPNNYDQVRQEIMQMLLPDGGVNFAPDLSEFGQQPHQQQAMDPSLYMPPNMQGDFQTRTRRGDGFNPLGSRVPTPGSHMQHHQHQQQSPGPSANFGNPQLVLDHQNKVQQYHEFQQLQQLQNDILQRQIAILNSQAILRNSAAASSLMHANAVYNGLPTPGPSTELRAQTNTLNDFVSPMMLDYSDNQPRLTQPTEPGLSPTSPTSTEIQSQSQSHRGSASAPASIAFAAYDSHAIDKDFDVSPLTSPWLGSTHREPPRHSPSNKRPASPSADDGSSTRKRSATNPTALKERMMNNTMNSNLATPKATPKQANTLGEASASSDLPMLPPSPMQNDDIAVVSSVDMAISPGSSLTPVTPASIMNMGRLMIHPDSLPPPQAQPEMTSPVSPMDSSAKGKAPARTRPPTRSSKRTGTGGHTTFKNILPAASTPSSKTRVVEPKQPLGKTSHKAAEQKRRDSMKSTFDDLRTLLPPISIDGDEFADEPLPPGARPPRGPPKAGGDGPNKGVSKLQLLICGNDFIRKLKGRVDRRDMEIDVLRNEVKRLRGLVGGEAQEGGEMDMVDLEKDLDAMEDNRSLRTIADDDEPDDD